MEEILEAKEALSRLYLKADYSLSHLHSADKDYGSVSKVLVRTKEWQSAAEKRLELLKLLDDYNVDIAALKFANTADEYNLIIDGSDSVCYRFNGQLSKDDFYKLKEKFG